MRWYGEYPMHVTHVKIRKVSATVTIFLYITPITSQYHGYMNVCITDQLINIFWIYVHCTCMHELTSMASEETSYNQDDAHATQVRQRDQWRQDQLVSCSEHVVSANLSDVQEEHSGFSTRFSMHSAEQESRHHDTATTMIFVAPTPAQQITQMSAEELSLHKELRKQRLQHRREEEFLEHLVKVKELTNKISDQTLKELPAPFMLGMLPVVQPPNPVNNSTNDINVGDTSSEPKNPVINPHWSREVELLQKLHLQRIQQQIEIEGAVHKLEMKHFLTLK